MIIINGQILIYNSGENADPEVVRKNAMEFLSTVFTLSRDFQKTQGK